MMTFSVEEDASAVLLPAFDGTDLSDSVLRCLDDGGVSILIGESREEYVARSMTAQRRAEETADTFSKLTERARARSGSLLAAVDQEIGGICRLHALVPEFPCNAAVVEMTNDEIEDLSLQVASKAITLGVNVFLAPILDVLTGTNAWLEGRTLSSDPEQVARIASAYIRGVQRGGVAATGKHFPGFGAISADPAIDASAVNSLSLAELKAGELPFAAAVEAGVKMMMVGPSIVSSYDPDKAALRSLAVVSRLKQALGFRGIVMADDLDSQATLRGDSVATVAVDALNAGCDYLLLADTGTQLHDVATAIASAARTGAISQEALALSANRVRALSHNYAAVPKGK